MSQNISAKQMALKCLEALREECQQAENYINKDDFGNALRRVNEAEAIAAETANWINDAKQEAENGQS